MGNPIDNSGRNKCSKLRDFRHPIFVDAWARKCTGCGRDSSAQAVEEGGEASWATISQNQGIETKKWWPKFEELVE